MSFGINDEIIQMLIPKFVKYFGVKPKVAGRSPGRVNLIGEHIDYCGFKVFPMALDGKHTTVLINPNQTGLIRGRNTDPEHYPAFDIPLQSPCSKIGSCGWAAYVEGAVLEYCRVAGFKLKGLDILVHGLVPIASGLSSSAALLCAITIALDKFQGIPHERNGLVDAAIEAEHRVGMNCGGMDQSISMFGRKGYACIIGFNPITIEHVQLPPAHFVVAHCMKKAAKVEQVDPTDCYNWRVKEVRRCAELMMPGKVTIGEVVQALNGDFEKAVALAEKLPETDAEDPKLVLKKRALHVLTEARRVLQMKGADLKTWGKLMCDSHESCRDFYHCSCAELDELVDVGMKSGALGGRMTGAGWGGSAVFMLSPDSDPNKFIEDVKKSYYEKHQIHDPIIFATSPGQGSEAFKFE